MEIRKQKKKPRQIPDSLKSRMSVHRFINWQMGLGLRPDSSGYEESDDADAPNVLMSDGDYLKIIEHAEKISAKFITWYDGTQLPIGKFLEKLQKYRGITNFEIGRSARSGVFSKKAAPAFFIWSNINSLPGITKIGKRKRKLDGKTVHELVFEEDVELFRIDTLINNKYGLATDQEKKKLMGAIHEDPLCDGTYEVLQMEKVKSGEKDLVPLYLRVLWDENSESDTNLIDRLSSIQEKYFLPAKYITTALKEKYRVRLRGKPAILVREFNLYFRKPPEFKFTLMKRKQKLKKRDSDYEIENEPLDLLVERYSALAEEKESD